MLKWAGSSALLALAIMATLCLGTGCSTVGYLAQSTGGHLRLLQAARPVDDWLADPLASDALKQRLALSQRMRRFAVDELHLPDNASYQRYADLARPAAVWNVVAAPVLSLKLHTWCFPVVGCIGYRGYYDKAAAEAEAGLLRAQGLEVSVYPVPAYSTLGMSNWVGGDPLLNTFIGWPEGELARLIFHELSHQVVYASGDTAFNESFATAVERLGGERWLSLHGSAQARQEYAALDQRRHQFRALVARYRQALEALYRSAEDDETKLRRKAELMAALRSEHAQLRDSEWGGFKGYDAFIAQANNASLGVQAAYHASVPAFEALFEREGRDYAAFYRAVERLAALPRPERDAQMRALIPNPPERP